MKLNGFNSLRTRNELFFNLKFKRLDEVKRDYLPLYLFYVEINKCFLRKYWEII